jgi:hypothetical protein
VKVSLFTVVLSLSLLSSAAASAARVDMNDPRRALGREDDIRIDAELLQDTLSPGSPLSVTYQVENLTQTTVGVADRISDVSYDPDSQTVTFSIGAEVPSGAAMPHVVTIAPGQKRVLTAGGVFHSAAPRATSPFASVPRYVQIKVNVLKDVGPFAALLAQQAASPAAPALPNDLFDKWVAANDAVFLNSIPVHWSGRDERNRMDASKRTPTE